MIPDRFIDEIFNTLLELLVARDIPERLAVGTTSIVAPSSQAAAGGGAASAPGGGDDNNNALLRDVALANDIEPRAKDGQPLWQRVFESECPMCGEWAIQRITAPLGEEL